MRASGNLAVTVVGAAAVVVLAGVAWFGTGTDALPGEPESGAPSSIVAVSGWVTVHVSGEVTRPGLVVVANDARLADVVRAAGGATADADLAGINLAASVRDGDHLVVPSLGDGVPSPNPDDGIDLNRASASQLEELPGVGPVLAERIVAHRDEHGHFSTVEDLLDVPGIGEAKLDQLRAAVSAP